MIHFYEEFVANNSSNTDSKKYACTDASSRQRQHPRSKSADKLSSWKSPDDQTSPIAIKLNSIQMSGAVYLLTPVQGTLLKNKDNLTVASQRKDRSKASPRKPKQKSGKEPARRLTLYERSQIRLKEREKNVQRIKEEMMKECTFRPKAVTSFRKGKSPTKSAKNSSRMARSPVIMNMPTGSTESTTPTTLSPTTASSTRQYWQDLQRKQQEEQKKLVSTDSTLSKEDGSKTISTTKSQRFEELYQDGLRRARRRPATEKVK